MRTLKKLLPAVLLVMAVAFARWPASSAAAPASATGPAALPMTLVTLKGQGISLGGAFAAFAGQTGLTFAVPEPDAQALVSVDINQRPMWDAVRQLLESAGQKQTYNFQMGSAGRNATYHGAWSSSGPFLVLATRVQGQFGFAGERAAASQMTVELQVIADPAVSLVYVDGASTPAQAVDDQGNSLLPAGRGFVVQLGRAISPLAHPVRVALQVPPVVAARTIHRLEGTIAAMAGSGYEKIEAPLAPSYETTFDGRKLTVTAKPAGTSYRIDAQFDAPPGIAREEWTAITRRYAAAQVSMADAAGKPIPVTASGSSTSALWFIVHGIAQNASAITEGKIILTVPTEAHELSIPYHFDDLPLP